VGRGAIAVFDVEDNNALHQILNEWADIVPAHFDTYPLIDDEAAKRMLAAQAATKKAMR
jgi:muconolactone delta-isomerase